MAGRIQWQCTWAFLIPLFWILTIVVGCFAILPWGIYELRKAGEETHVQAWFVAGIFTCLAVPISFWDASEHLAHWYNPRLQRLVIRVLWMVPIYAVDAFLALRFVDANIYLDVARECYEAYVIYNFYSFLLFYLRERHDFDLSLTRRENQPHLFPICWVKPWRMGQEFINGCTHGVTSYIVVRPLTTVIAFCCELSGTYGEGEFRGDRAYVYLAVVNSCSQMWAMYCLILFYYAFKEDLKGIRPLPKFIAIKSVVFFSFWQSVLISLLFFLDLIKDDPTWTTYNKENVAMGIQDFLICVEMFIAALAHHWFFSYKDFVGDRAPEPLSFVQKVYNLFYVRDVRDTVLHHIQHVTTLGGKIYPVDDAAFSSSHLHTPLLDDATGPSYGATRSSYGATSSTPSASSFDKKDSAAALSSAHPAADPSSTLSSPDLALEKSSSTEPLVADDELHKDD